MVPALLLALQTPYGLPADPLLDRPLAVEARIEPLPELLARMGTSLGMRLTVERRMLDLKATVFTSARPARLTMVGIASVFDAEWVLVKGGGYRLSETVPARNRREAYLAMEAVRRRELADRDLSEMPRVLEAPPPEDTSPRAEHLREIIEASRGSLPMRERVRTGYLRMSVGERERLWQGELVHQVGWTEGRPDETLQSRSGRTGIRRYPAGPLLQLFRYEPDAGIKIASYEPNNSAMWTAGYGAILHNDEVLRKTAFRAAQDRWESYPASVTAPELDLPLKTVEPKPSRWARGWYAESDVLESFFRASGIPVVAEATRRNIGHRATLSARTVRQAMTMKLGMGGWNRLEAGTLLHRPSNFWAKRITEPPEASIRSCEATPELTFVGSAEMYSALPRPAVRELRLYVLRHDMEAASEGLAALRLWGRLSPATQNDLLQGKGVPLSQVPTGVHQAVREAVADAIFDGRGTFVSEGAGRVETILRLLNLAPGGPQTLYARANAGTMPTFPPGPSFSSAQTDREIRAMAIWIVDPAGNGLKLFTKIR